jgi:hypothetical protein
MVLSISKPFFNSALVNNGVGLSKDRNKLLALIKKRIKIKANSTICFQTKMEVGGIS